MADLDRKKKKFTVPPSLVTLSYLLAMILGGFVPPMLLLTYCRELGIWWSILLFVHITLLCAGSGWSLYRREVTKLRVLLGDEGLYRIYPRERKRDARIAARRVRKAERLAERRERRREQGLAPFRR